MLFCVKQLMIVEDNKELQEILKERFDREGFLITQAFSAEEGLEMIKKNPPDMLLLDLMLPGPMSGNGLLAYIKNDQQFRDIQVAIFSNLDNPNKTTFSLENIDYMLKANTPLEDVVSVVKAHLAGVPDHS
jgi:DNA-binding response OmpR family regulator